MTEFECNVCGHIPDKNWYTCPRCFGEGESDIYGDGLNTRGEAGEEVGGGD